MKKLLLALLPFFLLAAPAGAANVNIDALPAASSVGTGDLFECEQSGTNRKCTSDQVKTFGGAANTPLLATNWYLALPLGSLTNGATFTASQIYCRYFQFPVTVSIATVGFNVTTGGGGNAQIAFYTNNASRLPGTLISNTGSISTTTTGNKSGALGATIQVGPGGSSTGSDVWACVNSDNATHVLMAFSTALPIGSYTMGSGAQNNIVAAGGNTGLDNISCNGANCNGGVSTFGTWPTLTGTTWTYNTTASRFPAIEFLVNSSP